MKGTFLNEGKHQVCEIQSSFQCPESEQSLKRKARWVHPPSHQSLRVNVKPRCAESARACECLPEEESELKHVQEARESQTPFAAEKDHVLVCCLEGFELQVIFKPEPAEHLDRHGWRQHEPDQQAEPEEMPVAEKLLREPQIRAHIKHIGAHTDYREHEIQPRVPGEHRGVHGEDELQSDRASERYILPFLLLQESRSLAALKRKLEKVPEKPSCEVPVAVTLLNASMLLN